MLCYKGDDLRGLTQRKISELLVVYTIFEKNTIHVKSVLLLSVVFLQHNVFFLWKGRDLKSHMPDLGSCSDCLSRMIGIAGLTSA